MRCTGRNRETDEILMELKGQCSHFMNGECRTVKCMMDTPAGPYFCGCLEYQAVKEIERLVEAENCLATLEAQAMRGPSL